MIRGRVKRIHAHFKKPANEEREKDYNYLKVSSIISNCYSHRKALKLLENLHLIMSLPKPDNIIHIVKQFLIKIILNIYFCIYYVNLENIAYKPIQIIIPFTLFLYSPHNYETYPANEEFGLYKTYVFKLS